MTMQEWLLRTASGLEPMVPALLVTAAATVAAAVVLFFLCRNAWIDQKRFRLLGLFFGLSRRGRLQLSCGWVRLMFVIAFVAFFRPLKGIQYAMVVMAGLMGLVLEAGIKKRLEGSFWLILQLLGLFSTDLVCRFLQEMSGSSVFLLIYIAMGLFLALFSLYLFLNDLGSVSGRRSVDPEKIWGKEER